MSRNPTIIRIFVTLRNRSVQKQIDAHTKIAWLWIYETRDFGLAAKSLCRFRTEVLRISIEAIQRSLVRRKHIIFDVFDRRVFLRLQRDPR